MFSLSALPLKAILNGIGFTGKQNLPQFWKQVNDSKNGVVKIFRNCGGVSQKRICPLKESLYFFYEREPFFARNFFPIK